MQFGILGPLQVRTPSGQDVAVAVPCPRALLTMLLLQAGRVVSADALVDGQYGDDLPTGAANAVQAQVSRLRRALPPGTIEFTGGGYRVVLRVRDRRRPAAQLDAARDDAPAQQRMLADAYRGAGRRVGDVVDMMRTTDDYATDVDLRDYPAPRGAA